MIGAAAVNYACGDLIWKWSVLSILGWGVICVLMGLMMTAKHKAAGYLTASYSGVLKIGLVMGVVIGLISGPMIGMVERRECQRGKIGPAESLWDRE